MHAGACSPTQVFSGSWGLRGARSRIRYPKTTPRPTPPRRAGHHQLVRAAGTVHYGRVGVTSAEHSGKAVRARRRVCFNGSTTRIKASISVSAMARHRSRVIQGQYSCHFVGERCHSNHDGNGQSRTSHCVALLYNAYPIDGQGRRSAVDKVKLPPRNIARQAISVRTLPFCVSCTKAHKRGHARTRNFTLLGSVIVRASSELLIFREQNHRIRCDLWA